MTIQTETSLSGPFTVGFRFLADSHLLVIRTSSAGVDTDLAITTDYTVTGAGGSSGTVTLVTALAIGESLTIARNVPFTQLADYVNNDAFPAESHEEALDLLTMQTQQLKNIGDRSLSLPVTAVGVSTELPAPQASTLIGWSVAGDELQNYDATALGIAIATASWRTDVFNGTGAATAFVLTQDAGVASNCDVSVSGVGQVAGVNYNYDAATKTITFLTGAPASGTGNVAVRYGQALPAGVVASTSINDSTAVGRSVLTAANATAARAAIGLSTYADLAVAQSFTAAQRGAVVALTYAATVTPDFALANNYSLALTGNVTLANPTNLVAGQGGVIVLSQDGSGSRTAAFGSYFKFPSGTAPTLTTTASAVDVLAYQVESATRITARLVSDVK